MEANEIMRILPHRYPFLLVDRVLECVPGRHITGVKSVTGCDACPGHGRGPVLPMSHLLVVEALAQVSVILACRTLALEPSGNELMFFAGIDSARFGHASRPGDRLLLHSEVNRIRKMVGWFRASASVDDKVVVEVSMLAAIRSAKATATAS